MISPDLTVVLQVLQMSISPAVLVSGAGLLILALSNRMANIIGRIRALNVRTGEQDADDRARSQIDMLYARARLLRLSMLAVSVCVLFSAATILTIFLCKLFGVTSGVAVTFLFCAALVSLIAGVGALILDANLNLKALTIEIGK